ASGFDTCVTHRNSESAERFVKFVALGGWLETATNTCMLPRSSSKTVSYPRSPARIRPMSIENVDLAESKWTFCGCTSNENSAFLQVASWALCSDSQVPRS